VPKKELNLAHAPKRLLRFLKVLTALKRSIFIWLLNLPILEVICGLSAGLALTKQPRKEKKYGHIPFESASDAERGFVAGLIDGEGALDIVVCPRTAYLGGGRKNPLLKKDWSMVYKYPRLRVEMSDYGDVSELARLFGEKCLLSKRGYFHVRALGGRCMRILMIVHPIMKNIAKRKIVKNWIQHFSYQINGPAKLEPNPEARPYRSEPAI